VSNAGPVVLDRLELKDVKVSGLVNEVNCGNEG